MAPPAGAANFGDYIVIPDGVDSSAVKVEGCIASVWDGVNSPGLLKIKVPTISKFCGNRLSCIHNNPVSAEVISSVLPFTLGVVTNDHEKSSEMNRGFKLDYRQQLC